MTLVCFMPPLAGRLKLPYSVLLAIVGCLLGIIVHVHGWAPSWIGDFLDSLERFEISSETFLMVFLPVLLFETALSMNVRRLMDDIGPILMMAIVAVVVCTVVVGVTLDAISPYGWWCACCWGPSWRPPTRWRWWASFAKWARPSA